MCMFGNRSQKTSKCGEEKQEAQEVPPCNKFFNKLILIIFNKSAVGADYGKPCSDIYPGERPFSEPETHNLATYMYSIRDRIKAYVDFHSYGQLWMSPWGFKKDLPPTYRTMNVSLQYTKANPIKRLVYYRLPNPKIKIILSNKSNINSN